MEPSNLRPVIIRQDAADTSRRGTYFKQNTGGLFHGWAGTSEWAYALIELRDGSIAAVRSNEFYFTDQFLNTAWVNVLQDAPKGE